MKRIFYSMGFLLVCSSVSAQITNNGTLFVSDGTVVSIGMDVTNNGKIVNEGKLHFQKNVVNNQTFDSKGTVVFDGSEQQTLNSYQPLTLAHLSLENDLTVSKQLEVANSLDFRRGILTAKQGEMVVFGKNAIHQGASDFSHIVGDVSKLEASKFEFPVGDGVNYRGFELSNGQGNNFRASYTAQNPTALSTAVSEGVEAINQEEYWRLASANSQVEAKLNLASTVYDLEQVTYLKQGTWEMANDNVVSTKMGLKDGIVFTAGRGKNIRQEIGIWPNPTQGEFNLKLAGMNQNDNVQVVITNQDGRVVMNLEGKVKDIRKTYDLPQSLPSTELTVRVVNGTETLTQKLILNR